MNIPNPHLDGQDAAITGDMRLRRMAAAASLGVGAVLIIVKLAAFLITNAVSLLSSLMDSVFDLMASLVAMLSIIHAATPADRNHRYGHGKLEALGAMGQALFIFGSSVFLLVESVRRFVSPEAVREAPIGIAVICFSLVLTGGLILFQRYVLKKTASVAVAADHLHYKGDIVMNLSVLAALALSHYSDWPYFDPLFAAGIAVMLLLGAYRVARHAFDILMDKELPPAERKRIKALVQSHPAVEAVHDLRTRSTGERLFIEFHVELDGEMTLNRAHDITEELEKMLYAAFPKAEVLMHQEPAGIEDHRLDHSIAEQEKAKTEG